MIINFVQVAEEEKYGGTCKRYIVGACIEENWTNKQKAAFIPITVELWEYPNKSYTKDMERIYIHAQPEHFEREMAIEAIPELLKSAWKIKDLSQEEAEALLFGQAINPVQKTFFYMELH